MKASMADIYAALRDDKESVFLEWKKPYIALDPYMTFKSKGRNIWINGRLQKGNPFDVLHRLVKKHKYCFGYMGYDLAHFIEKLPGKAKDDLNLPDSYFIFPGVVISCSRRDNGRVSIYAKDKKRLNEIIRKINKIDTPSKSPALKLASSKAMFRSNFSFESYKKAIMKAKEYVKSGDSYQIKLSQRLEFDIKENPFDIYRKLRQINPSSYSGFLNFNDFQLVSCSPELLLNVEKGRCITRPIGGTYPRGKNSKEDRKLSSKFMNDEKELAEHTMLIDLERNDLGKVCEYGSVKVDKLMELEKYSHLMHIVTTISGKLQKGKDIFDAVKAMFPGGTVTGCPKVRTMEIIDELEPVVRGPYSGSMGFFTPDSCMLNIIIRTLIVTRGKGYVQVGGGIVADSDPEREYEETIDKGKALSEAVVK